MEEIIYKITAITLKNDSPRIPNTAPIHPVLRSTIPVLQDLMTEFLPWLFEPGRKILLKNDGKKIYLEWNDISFSTPNSMPQVLCQWNQTGFNNTVNIQYSIYEDGGQKSRYNTQIHIPMVSGLGETDPWGLKAITMRPYTLGGYTLTGKGMPKYPISIEHDRYYFGQAKKKTINTNFPQFSFTVDKDMIHPADKGQTPQHFKIVLDLKSADLDISCNNSHVDLRLQPVNIINLIWFLSNRSHDEIGRSLKLSDYSGHPITPHIHAIIDLIISRAESTKDSFKITAHEIENLMSQYVYFSDNNLQENPLGINKMKALMLELQVRRMLVTLFASNYHPDRDSLQRKRYLSSGKFFAHVFMLKMIDICNLKNSAKQMDKIRITKEVEKILSSIVSTINTDISTGSFEKKTGIWVHDASTSMINNISKLTVCAKKLMKEITKDLTFRYYHTSQTGFLCPYDVPEHGENVGLVNSTTILTKISHIFPKQKYILAKEIHEAIKSFQASKAEAAAHASKRDEEYLLLLEDVVVGRAAEEDARELYYALRYQKRANNFSRNDFGVVLDPYLLELRVNIASGRLVQPILVVTDGVLELIKAKIDEESLKDIVNLEDFMKKYPHVLEFIDCDSFQVSSRRGGRVFRSIADYNNTPKDERYKTDFCCLSDWGYLGWNINHIILRNNDEAIRSVFYCSLSKSGIHNKILTRNTFDSYHKYLYSELLLYTNPVIESSFMGRLAYAEVLWVAMLPAMGGLNQEDGSIANKDATDVGMLTSLRVIKYNLNVDKVSRLTNTKRVVRHADQGKIDPVSGLPIVGSYLVKGDAMVRNYEQISTSSTGITHTDKSESYIEYTPAMVERVITYPENPSLVSLLLVTYNPLINGDKLSTIAAQKSTSVSIVKRIDLPSTTDGMYPQLIMSSTGVLSRKTLSMIISSSIFLPEILDWTTHRKKTDRIQVRMGAIENLDWVKLVEKCNQSFTEAKKDYDLWKGQNVDNLTSSSMVMIHPHTKEVMEDIFFAPFHVYRSKHLANPKKNVCHKGRSNQETGQTTNKRSSGGAPKLDEMTRNGIICYEAAYTLLELVSDPDDKKHTLHICSNCSMFAQHVRDEDESYYVCKICLSRFSYSSVFELQLTYAGRKFFEYPRGRGIQIVLHPRKRKDLFLKYKTEV